MPVGASTGCFYSSVFKGVAEERLAQFTANEKTAVDLEMRIVMIIATGREISR
jgi:hypothetical protein